MVPDFPEGEPLVADLSADMLGFPEPDELCLGEEMLWFFGLEYPDKCLGLFWTGECLGLLWWLEVPDGFPMLFTVLGLGDFVIETDLPWVGLGLNFRSSEFGDVGRMGDPSVGLMLTDTGLVSGSCLGGTFSGGPMESSRRRFFFLSLLRSSDLLDFLSDRMSRVLSCEEVMGVIVIELGSAAGGAAVMGMISMPGRRSRHSMDDRLAGAAGAGAAPMGVMLTDDGM